MDKVLRIGAEVKVDSLMKDGMNLEAFEEMTKHDLARHLSSEIVRHTDNRDISISISKPREPWFNSSFELYKLELMVATPEAFEAEIERRVKQRVSTYKARVSKKVDELKEVL